MAGAHARLAPSAAHRWINCPGSVGLIERLGLGDDGGSEYSRAGTAQHEVAAACLHSGADAWEHVGTKRAVEGHEVEITPEMGAAIQVYLDEARRLAEEVGGVMFVEHEADLRLIHPDIHGTLDLGVATTGYVQIADAKFGYGVVEPNENPQLMIYAAALLAAARKTGADPVNVGLTIVQPNAPHPDGPVRTWWIAAADLDDWVGQMLWPAAEATDHPNAPLTPGDHCQYCPARTQCPALRAMFKEMEADVTEAFEPVAMANWEISSWMGRFSAIRQFMATVEAECERRLLAGQGVPGWKLVARRANRIWRDGAEDAVVQGFGEEAWNRSLKSPAQVEKMPGGKATTAEWAYKPENGLTIAAESDKRPAVPAPTASAAFAGFTDTTDPTKE